MASSRRRIDGPPLEVEPSTAGAAGGRDLEEKDVLLPAQRVYAMAVNQAERKYRKAIAAAWEERQGAVDEALKTCILAMEKE